MWPHRRSWIAGATLLGSAFLCGCPPKPETNPNPAVTERALTCDLGSQQVDGTSYSIRATVPITSELTSQRLQIMSSGVTAPYGSLTRIFTIRTGSSRTVAYMCGRMHDIFQKFLRGQPARTEIAVVGDARRGGDGIRFIADSPDVFRYETFTPDGKPPQSISLAKVNIQAFDQILVKALENKRH